MISSQDTSNQATKYLFYSSIFWLPFAMVIGLVLSLKYVYPNFLAYGFAEKYLSYGRIRPTHTNTVTLGWLSMAYIAGLFYVIPKLTRTPLMYPRLGMMVGHLWNIFHAVGVVTLMLGYTSTIEYAEYLWPIDIVFFVLFGLIMFICFKTIMNRRERQLYVSLWYFMASLLWFPVLYIIGNIPNGIIGGVPQALAAWYYGHNVVGLWFTTVGVGFIYYLLPKLSHNPLYSHKLSLIGFWGIATFYVWNGPHHLQNGPLPGWLMKSGVIPSILLIIPVWSVIANFFGTLKGKWHRVAQSVPLKFLMTGVIFYLLTCLQGPFQSLMGPSSYLKFTNWVVGHAHMPLYGAFSFVLFSLIYYSFHEITGKQIYSRNLMNLHYWLSLIGFLIFGFSTWTQGVLQGFAWAEGNQFGYQFTQTLIALRPFSHMRTAGGALMFIGTILFVINIYKSARSKSTAENKNRQTA